MRELLAVEGLADTTNPFRAKLVQVADELGLNPSDLAAVISFETSGTFRPDKYNKDDPTGTIGSKAVGLIQFLPSTAKNLGTSTKQLAKMSATKQLDYVALYYKGIGPGRINTSLDHYLAVFSPKYIGDPPNTPMYLKGSKGYDDNAKMDADNDGIITVGDVGERFLQVITSAASKPPILVDVSDAPSSRGVLTGASIALIAVTIYGLTRLTKATHHQAAL